MTCSRSRLLASIFVLVALVSKSLIDAQQQQSFTVPKIVSLKPSHANVAVKSSAIFECQVVAYPLAKISWRKNGKRVSEAASKTSKFKQSHGSNVSILRVNDINHAMNITCVAENGVADANLAVFDASSASSSYQSGVEATAFLRTRKCSIQKYRLRNSKYFSWSQFIYYYPNFIRFFILKFYLNIIFNDLYSFQNYNQI